uniref:Si:ch73-329n5.2 n=1 Tax=Myripristis murdjan TaxID=586833 RepID=A0A668AVY0_9TELE
MKLPCLKNYISLNLFIIYIFIYSLLLDTMFLKIFFGCWYDVETYETCILMGIFVVTYILSFPGSFYPRSGTANGRIDDGSSSLIALRRPFVYFGRQYNQIYVNNNGHLTFDAAWGRFVPYRFPGNASRDLIAPFWTDLDNRQNGQVLYNQYTTGSVLQRATQDINTYFPDLNFVANWVFVATWYEVAYYSTSGTRTTFQAVLISGGQYSFVLMNYGTIAQTSRSVQAGYDTISSRHYFSIPGSFSSTATGSNSVFRQGSNVNVPGRWAFRTDSGTRGCNVSGTAFSAGLAEYISFSKLHDLNSYFYLQASYT